jgi:predicted nucleotidyltransferase
MATTRIPPDFKEFLRLLNEKKVEYLVIGGYAVGFHGFPRPTGDLDVWIAVHPANIDGALDALREFGYGSTGLSPDLFGGPRPIIRMGISPVRIEIQTAISGVSFSECFRQRVIGDFDGVPVNLISLEHLKKNKRAAGRHKDLNDLDNLP